MGKISSSVTEIAVAKSEMGPARLLIWTHRIFYEGKSGESRSRKPSQPGWTGSYEEALKGLAKLGNIVAETMFLVMFPGVGQLGNVCFGCKNVFDSTAKTIFVSEQQNLFPQHMFPTRLNWETFASATMFPSLAKQIWCACEYYRARKCNHEHE